MKELRENNKTRKIYPIDPYVEVYQFRDNEYELFTENCDDMGDFFMHLIIGPERRCSIDAGYGFGDTKGLVDQLTGGKPLIVANTHEHPDHALGNCRFDKVYCHDYLVPSLERQNEHQWDYLFDEHGNNIWLQFDRKDLPKFKKYEIAGVKDGYTFHLGGDYEVELVFTGGIRRDMRRTSTRKAAFSYTGDNICSDVSSCGSINMASAGSVRRIYSAQGVPRQREEACRPHGRIRLHIPQSFHHQHRKQSDAQYPGGVRGGACESGTYDYKAESAARMSGERSVRYYKYIKGFSVLAYGYNKA